MISGKWELLAVAFSLAGILHADTAAKESAEDAQVIEGLWSGSWGGAERDGVIMQPVIAELLVDGDHVELYGFRNVSRLTGSARLNTVTKRMLVTPTMVDGGQPAGKSREYRYEIAGDKLILSDSEGFRVSLERVPVARDPWGNVEVELVEATGINDAGELLVTKLTVLRAGEAATYLQPETRLLTTEGATVRVVQEVGWKHVTVDEARELIGDSLPVVVAFRGDGHPSRHQPHKLWKEAGSPQPDSDPVWQTFTRMLRPGTLVFILSARENIPQP